MRIRYKFLLVLLAFSLIPLLVVTAISRHHIQRLGNSLADRARTNLTQIVIRDLEQAAEFSADAIRYDIDRIHISLRFLNSAVAHALQQTTPPAAKRLYLYRDFDHPLTAPPDLATSWRYRRLIPGGGQAASAISMEHPVFFVPQDQQTNPEASWRRLAGIGDVLKQIYGHSGSTVHRVYFGLENGVHVSYPGHGHYQPTFDPRRRPWYQKTTPPPGRCGLDVLCRRQFGMDRVHRQFADQG